MGLEATSNIPGEEGASRQGSTQRAEPAAVSGVRLASAVMFVQNLDASMDFYRQFLNMDIAVCQNNAALLVNPAGFQLYLRSRSAHTHHALGGIGVQYVIWSAADEADLRRCEHFLREAGVHVHTQTAGGFTLVEGRDPSGVPVVVTYPGPDQAERQEIMSRVYAW